MHAFFPPTHPACWWGPLGPPAAGLAVWMPWPSSLSLGQPSVPPIFCSPLLFPLRFQFRRLMVARLCLSGILLHFPLVLQKTPVTFLNWVMLFILTVSITCNCPAVWSRIHQKPCQRGIPRWLAAIEDGVWAWVSSNSKGRTTSLEIVWMWGVVGSTTFSGLSL